MNTTSGGSGQASEPVLKAVERILDEESAWIARPNDEVTRRIALRATLAAVSILEKQQEFHVDHGPNCGCRDCLEIDWWARP
jgi:hypothetical protein